MNNQENNRYIDPKTGSGYVPAGKSNMDFPIAIAIGIVLIVVIGGGILLFTNEDVREFVNEGFEAIAESFVDEFEEDYEYDEDEYDEYEDELEDGLEDAMDHYNDSNQYSIREFKEIDARDIVTDSRDKTIVVWIGRQSCGYCKSFAPIIEEVTDDFDITARYIDLEKIINFNAEYPYISDQDAFDILSDLEGKGEWLGFASDNIGGTPLTLIIKNNEVIGGVVGYVLEDRLTREFIAAGLRN